MVITANEIKRRGVSYLLRLIKKNTEEVLISLRGKTQLVVLPLKEYERLKELELISAVNEVMKEYSRGDFTEETAEEHIKKLGI